MAQDQMEVTQEQFKNWTENEITKQVVKQVIDIRENLKNTLASGYTIALESDISTDRLVGRIEGISELFNLFNDVEEKNEEKVEYGH